MLRAAEAAWADLAAAGPAQVEFVDVGRYVRDTGNASWYRDRVHLSPRGYAQIMRFFPYLMWSDPDAPA